MPSRWAVRWLSWWCALGLARLLCASDALAWNAHSLNAQAGNVGDSSSDPNDVSVDALDQFGVPGVNDFAYFAHAAANSDTGILLAESLIDPGTEVPASSVTIAGIQQWLHVDDVGEPIAVRFSLDLDLSADVVGTGSASAAGRLDVTSLCNVYVEVYAVGDPEIIDGCTEEYGFVSFVASAGPGAIHVDATWDSGQLPSNIDFLVQVENELNVGFIGSEVGQAFAGGALSITVEGAGSYSFTSPTFLTLPEPDDCAASALALAALASLRRSKRQRDRGSPRDMRHAPALARAGALACGIALAPQANAYQIVADAFGHGEGSLDSNVDTANGFFGDANGDYSASADAPSGEMHASAAVHAGSFTMKPKRSVARIEERVTFDGVPTGPVTVTIGLGFGGGADAGPGANSRATGGVGTSNCRVNDVIDSASGALHIDNCVGFPGGSGGDSLVTLVIAPEFAGPGDVLDLFAQVEAQVFGADAAGETGAAEASGILYVLVGGNDAYHFQNPDSFTVPEPGAALLGAAAAAAFAVLSYRCLTA